MSKASVYFKMNDIDGKHDVKELKRELDSFSGVISVSVNDEKNTLAVDYDNSGVSPGQIAERVESMGYRIESQKTETHVM